jgi:hypothetical protein
VWWEPGTWRAAWAGAGWPGILGGTRADGDSDDDVSAISWVGETWDPALLTKAAAQEAVISGAKIGHVPPRERRDGRCKSSPPPRLGFTSCCASDLIRGTPEDVNICTLEGIEGYIVKH